MQTQVRQLPPGITPPLVIKYSASSIPVIQLGLSSPTLPEQTVFDTAVNVLRPQLDHDPRRRRSRSRTAARTALISVDLDMPALQARGLSPADVVNAINTQNLILPSGTAKFGATEYTVRMNGSPDAIAGLNDLPVRTADGATTYLRDVAQVRDGFSPQTNIVRQDGERGVLLSVLKNGGASTLDIVANLRAMLPRVTRGAAAGHQGHAAVRPVGVRQGGGQGRGARGADRRRADRRDGAAVPRQLAQHADHRADDSAVDPGVDPRAQAAGRDAQPHDARRPRAVGRHPGRPGDRDDREHRAPPAHGQPI